MPKSNDSDVIISIGDLRKIVNYPGGVEAIDLIVDKLEELENRIEYIESHINKDKLVAENGWK